MYLEQFGLSINPFSLSPKLEFLYKSDSFQESMAHLVYGVDNSEAITMITGAIGTGKTMSLQSFLAHLGPSFKTALVTNTRVNSLELLKLILEDLGLPLAKGTDKSDLLIQFKEFLIKSSNSGCRVIIIIDEAQNLKLEVLEEVRLLTNLGQGDQQPVQVILVGQPELEEVINQPNLAQLRQRIRVHYRLAALSSHEVQEYLDHRMKVAGCDRKVFRPKAVEKMLELSGGIPRLINALAGNALLAAYVAGRETVEPEDVVLPEGVALPAMEPAVPFEAEAPEVKVAPAPEAKEASGGKKAKADLAPQAAPPVAHAHRARKSEGKRRFSAVWILVVVLLGSLGVLYGLGYLDGITGKKSGRKNAQVAGVARPLVEPEARSQAGQAATEQENQTSQEDRAHAGPMSGSDGAPSAGQPDANPAVIGGAPSGVATVNHKVDSGDSDAGKADAGTLSEQLAVTQPAATQTAGTQPVAARAAKPATAPGKFYVHLASFRGPERADSYIERLEGSGHDGTIRVQDVGDRVWYRVYAGPYADHDDALHHVEELQKAGGVKYYHIVTLD